MKKLPFLLLVLIFISGCSFGIPTEAPFQPSTGSIFTSYRAPLTTEFKNVDVPKDWGEADAMYIGYYFLTFAWGDAGLQNAMREGYLDNVAYADYQYTSVLGLFSKTTVRAFGDENPRK